MKKHLLILSLVITFINLNAQNNNSFLWRITKSGTDSSSYVYGTIHLPQEKFMKLPDSVYDAVNRTAVFYNEVDFLNMAQEMAEISEFSTKALAYMDSVQKTAAWRRLVADINRIYKKQINPDSLEEFTRFSQGLLMDLFKPDPGVTSLDVGLASFATVLGKPTKGLERAVTQFKMLYGLIDARLRDSTLLFQEDIRVTRDLAKLYYEKKLDSIQKLVTDIHPVYRKLVFDNRNKTMADSMEKAMKASTAFFAIGAGHLPGAAGVITILKSRGFDVQPVFSSSEISLTLMKDLFTTAGQYIRKMVKKKEEENESEGILLPPPPPPKQDPDGVKISPLKKPAGKPKTKKQ